MRLNRKWLEDELYKRLSDSVAIQHEADPKQLIKDGIDAICESMFSHLSKGNDLNFVRFGRFKMTTVDRPIMNPAANELIGYGTDLHVVFTPSKNRVRIHES